MGNTIWGIGRNYKDHTQEMKAETPQEPIVFIKAWATMTSSKEVIKPSFIAELHHEIEIAIQLGNQLQPEYVALALDLTARDLQTQAKKNGLPWSLAKSFTNACPISTWIPYKNDEWFSKIQFDLVINDRPRQSGKVADMIFPLPKIIRYLCERFPVQSGDIILTGTPAGVGPLIAGDVLIAHLNSEINWSLMVTEL